MIQFACKFETVSFQEIMLSSGVFRRETASGFYPWGKVEGPRKRVAEGLCGWRHGNSFPMTQSAQSHRQMRSIPRCSKAVFYVFVFDYIHDSATMHNLCPQKFSTEPKFDLLAKTKMDGDALFVGANLSILIPLEALPFGERHPNSSTIKRS